MSNPDRDKLVSAVYAATLSPESFEKTLDTIDNLIFGEHLNLQEAPGDFGRFSDTSRSVAHYSKFAVDPQLLTHFKIAHEIQLRLGRGEPEKSQLLLLLDAAPNPAYVFDSDEKIIAVNKLAKSGDGVEFAKLEEYCANPELLNAIRDFMSRKDTKGHLVVPGFVDSKKNIATCVLVKKLEKHAVANGINANNLNDEYYFFTIVNLGFDTSKTGLFQDSYGLTAAEVDIAILLAKGKQIPEIAAHRNTSVATIRTQFKSIKKKTNSRDISAVIRLLCGFSAGIMISSQLSAPKLSHIDPSPLFSSRGQTTLRDGRKMSYLEQGNPAGIPIIMIHNMPYGVEMPNNAIRSANRLNLRIITPFRPGYGDSDLIDEDNLDKLLDVVAKDISELMANLKITKATIIGQTIGSVYAMRFAKLFPSYVSGLIAISRTPIWRDEWLAKMPKRQRFSMRLAKHLPQLLPLVMRATVVFIDQGHGAKLVHGLCNDSPVDRQALKSHPEIVDLMVAGCEEGLKQGADAFCKDCLLSIRDFSQEAASLQHKFHILHGDSDRIVDVSQSQAFVNSVPGTTLEIVKGAGQLLFYTHWDRVLKAIRNKQKSTQTSI